MDREFENGEKAGVEVLEERERLDKNEIREEWPPVRMHMEGRRKWG